MAFQTKSNNKAAGESAGAQLVVACPSCSFEFEVSETVLSKLRQSSRSEFEAWKAEFEAQQLLEQAEFDRRVEELNEREANQRKLIAQQVEEQVREKTQAEYADLVKKANLDAQAEADKKVIAMQTELEQNQAKLAQLQSDQAELEKQKRDFLAAQGRFELEKQKAITLAIEAEADALRTSIKQDFEEKMQMQALELARAREQINTLNDKLKCKPSQELQGEALELDLEAKLAAEFPTDEVTPVKKGQRGADLLQVVNGRMGVPAGTILWEVKRTQNWSGEWIRKLKEDQRQARASMSVIITEVTPANIDTFGLVDGVVVTKPHCALAVALFLREAIQQTQQARRAAEGVETKAGLVYQYLMGDEFKARFGAIVDTFVDMQNRLTKERSAAFKNFELRRTQQEIVMKACFGVMGDLQGIAGQDLKSLEEIEHKALPQSEDDEELA